MFNNHKTQSQQSPAVRLVDKLKLNASQMKQDNKASYVPMETTVCKLNRRDFLEQVKRKK